MENHAELKSVKRVEVSPAANLEDELIFLQFWLDFISMGGFW